MRNTSARAVEAAPVETRTATESPAVAESVERYSSTSPEMLLRPERQEGSPGRAFSAGIGLGRSTRKDGGGLVPPSSVEPGGCSRQATSTRHTAHHHPRRPISPPPSLAGEGKDGDHRRQRSAPGKLRGANDRGGVGLTSAAVLELHHLRAAAGEDGLG